MKIDSYPWIADDGIDEAEVWMLRYRRGALSGTQERKDQMQQTKLETSEPPPEAGVRARARVAGRPAARAATKNLLGPRLFKV